MASIKKEIRFTEPTLTGSEIFDVAQCLEQFNRASYIAQCEALLESMTGCQKALLTPSCTSALELAAIVAGIGPGDEVIMPSYTFVSTANAFVLRGARIKYIDVRPDTLNIDETKIEDAINERTKAIVAVHYAGVSCEMHSIAKIAREYDLMLIEDAAQGIGATYQGSPLGSIGHLAAFSFHSTKNIHSGGEGGALLINDKNLIDRAMVVQEKGTNRHDYLHGKVNKYSWVSLGSSFLISEIQAAFLLSQLRAVNPINKRRYELWEQYRTNLDQSNFWQVSRNNPGHNSHIFFVLLKDSALRDQFIDELAQLKIQVTTHYEPLHTSPFGKKTGEFCGTDRFTSVSAASIVRLPLHHELTQDDATRVINAIWGLRCINKR